MKKELMQLIKNKYGTIDNMLNYTNKISRAYLYQLTSGKKRNVSIDYAKEIIRLLDIDSIDELAEML